jgi:hypothetical protein
LAEAGIDSSVGRGCDSHDNAMAESIIGLCKTEMIWPRVPWKNLDVVESATLKWVSWCNNQRLLEPIGNIPSVEFEAAYYEQERGQAIAARLTRESLRDSLGGSLPQKNGDFSIACEAAYVGHRTDQISSFDYLLSFTLHLHAVHPKMLPPPSTGD